MARRVLYNTKTLNIMYASVSATQLLAVYILKTRHHGVLPFETVNT